MTYTKLWNDIQMVYKSLFISGHLIIIDNLTITSDDNYFLIHVYDEKSRIKVRIKMTKEYNLVNMWNDQSEDGAVSYNLTVLVDGQTLEQDSSKIDRVYEVLRPYIRQSKLKDLGV